MRFDIHNKSGELARTLERIKESKDITERNKTIINDFYNFCVAQGLSLGRILSYVALLMRISLILNKDFESAIPKSSYPSILKFWYLYISLVWVIENEKEV
jgi:uncharacterized membrane protein